MIRPWPDSRSRRQFNPNTYSAFPKFSRTDRRERRNQGIRAVRVARDCPSWYPLSNRVAAQVLRRTVAATIYVFAESVRACPGPATRLGDQ